MKIIKSDEVVEYEAPHQPTRRVRIIADSENMGTNTFSVGMSIYGMDESAPIHSHKGEEVIFIIHGKGRFSTKEKSIIVEQGTMLHFPPGEEHSLENIGTESLEFIFIYVPGGDERRIKSDWIAKRS